jgi:hypothetical protein
MQATKPLCPLTNRIHSVCVIATLDLLIPGNPRRLGSQGEYGKQTIARGTMPKHLCTYEPQGTWDSSPGSALQKTKPRTLWMRRPMPCPLCHIFHIFCYPAALLYSMLNVLTCPNDLLIFHTLHIHNFPHASISQPYAPGWGGHPPGRLLSGHHEAQSLSRSKGRHNFDVFSRSLKSEF